MKAILSVYDKTGILGLAKSLVSAGIDLISTGGTHQLLALEAVPVSLVSALTGSPEILGGRVKTLHPVIHGGLLAVRDNPDHMAELEEHAIDPLDIVVVNLYPFEDTIGRPGVEIGEVLENIDIGGPTLLRAAAKNHPGVVVIVDPNDYEWVADALNGDGVSLRDRRRLAAKAFSHVARYDSIVSKWLNASDEDLFPEELTLGLKLVSKLRYGENSHQKGAVYAASGQGSGIVAAKQLHGKELSYNNILDADAAWIAAADFPEPAVAVVKHTNPCGLATHPNVAEAYRRAHAGDPVSAFGGILGFNREVTLEAAEALRSVFYEVIVAPAYTPEALEVLTKKRDLRILQTADPDGVLGALEVRHVSGGALVQESDVPKAKASSWTVATARQPSESEWDDLVFAWRAVRHVKSNAIILVRNQAIVGLGAGQPNRVNSVHLALREAGERATGAVLASDAFFPFADGIEMAVSGGVTALIQPGGSIRDTEVLAAADQAGASMVFTGERHFRH